MPLGGKDLRLKVPSISLDPGDLSAAVRFLKDLTISRQCSVVLASQTIVMVEFRYDARCLKRSGVQTKESEKR